MASSCRFVRRRRPSEPSPRMTCCAVKWCSQSESGLYSACRFAKGCGPAKSLAYGLATSTRTELPYSPAQLRGAKSRHPEAGVSRRIIPATSATRARMTQWLELLTNHLPDGWLFPSETSLTPLWYTNVLRRSFRPALKKNRPGPCDLSRAPQDLGNGVQRRGKGSCNSCSARRPLLMCMTTSTGS